MKFIIKALFSIVIFSTVFVNQIIASNTDDDDEHPWAIGVQGGLNISNKNNDHSWGSKTGYEIGVFVDYTLYEFVFVRSGLKYTTKGANYTNANTIIDFQTNEQLKTKTNIKTDIGALHAPLALGVKIQMTDDFILNIIAGGYVEYGLSHRVTNSMKTQSINLDNGSVEDGKTNSNTNSGNQYSHLKKGDIGVMFGFEGEYKQFVLGLNYERGFRDLRIKPYNELFTKWQNKTGVFYVGYKFNL